MDKIIKNILKKIEDEGYEAYIVGGFVRDKLLKRQSYDIDICTTALPKELKTIFDLNQESNGYGGYSFKLKKYTFDITTYRKESKYNDLRHPSQIEYITNLIEDVKRRDFTINAICMDKNEHIIDLVDGKKDLNNKLIRVIGDTDEKFKEDPLRILRAIRFATVLYFDIDAKTLKYMKTNIDLIKTLSKNRIKEEVSKILTSKNYMIGLKYLDELGISSIIGLKYDKIVYTSDLLGMYAQIELNVEFSKTEKENISKVRQILVREKIENQELFNYGLYFCTVAGEILSIPKSIINKKYNALPIKSMKDIDITGDEIMNLLNLKPSKLISEIINDVKNQILTNNLKNKKGNIKTYIQGKWKNE